MAIGIAIALALVCFRALAPEMVYPVERSARAVIRGIGRWAGGCLDGVGTAAENARLRRELDELKVLVPEMDGLRRENDALRRMLAISRREPKRWLAAEVLSAGGGTASSARMLRLSRGSAEGIREDAVAVVGAGLVGLVTRVTPHTAELTLLGDPQLLVACRVKTKAPGRPASGLLSAGGDRLVLAHLEAPDGRCAAEVGDEVLTSGVGGVYPAGFTVGTVSRVLRNERGGVVSLEVIPAVDFGELEQVLISDEK